MTRAEALHLSGSSQLHQRLRAARYFARYATADDEPAIRQWRTRESVGWIRNALRQALAKCGGEPSPRDEQEIPTDDSDAGNDIYAQAIEETTGRLVHEIEPILGLMRLHAQKEVPHFPASQLKRQLDRLDSLLRAIDTLSRTAAVAKNEELNLPEMVRGIVEAELAGHRVPLDFAGPDPIVVVGDRALLEVVVSNGVRNAIEATDEILPTRDARVVVSWGETDRDCWIAILDRGPGLPRGASRLFEIGATTKEGHFGMGLALARRAMLSLGGSIVLRAREDGGAAFECRWPKP